VPRCQRFEELGVEFVKRPSDGKMKGIAFIKGARPQAVPASRGRFGCSMRYAALLCLTHHMYGDVTCRVGSP